MTLQNTYIGAQLDGTADLAMASTVAYTIPVTVAEDGWLVAIEAEFGAPTTTVALRIAAGVWADDGGAPATLIHPSQLNSAITRPILDTTDRWVTVPVGAWFPAGTYHLGVKFVGSTSPILRTRTGGVSGDGHTVNGDITTGLPDGDYSLAVVTATDNTYSVRGVFITEAGVTPPDAPTNPAAVADSSTQITVSWDDVADETGYRVERSPDGAGSWVDVSGNLAADTTSWPNTGLTASTQYFYRIIAFNTGGDSSPSSTVNATTDAASGGGNRMGGTGAIRKSPRGRSGRR